MAGWGRRRNWVDAGIYDVQVFPQDVIEIAPLIGIVYTVASTIVWAHSRRKVKTPIAYSLLRGCQGIDGLTAAVTRRDIIHEQIVSSTKYCCRNDAYHRPVEKMSSCKKNASNLYEEEDNRRKR